MGVTVDPKNFGTNLKRILYLMEITQTELAEMTGLTQAACSQILNGKRDPSLSTVCQILSKIPVKFETLVRDL